MNDGPEASEDTASSQIPPAAPPPAGWSVLKVLGLAVGIIGMAGFGLCSLFGLAIGVSDMTFLPTVLMFALPGLVLAALFFWLARKMIRMARAPRP